jgi:hypothetical protein
MDIKPFMIEVTLYNLEKEQLEQVALGFENEDHLKHTIRSLEGYAEFYKGWNDRKRQEKIN